MTAETTQTTPRLVRALKLRDLVLFNLVAVLGLRHLGTTAKFGPGSLLMWLIAAVFFFIPQGLAVMELSSRFPKEGGIYFWTKRALGEGHGFLCGWCYWINNVLCYPNLLISAAVIATLVFAKSETGLSDNWVYVLPMTLGTLWIAVLINIVGLGTGKWLQNAGGVGTYIPGLILILLGAYGAMSAPPANQLSLETLKPDLNNLPALNLLASIAFAFAGLELASTMADEVENPRRNLPRAIFISAPLIAVIYIVGTAAVLWRLPNKEINVVSGFLQAIKTGSDNISPMLGRIDWWMAHRLERYDRHFVCDDYRDDSSSGYRRLSALSVKSYWWRARIRFDRRLDLRVRAFEEKTHGNFELKASDLGHSTGTRSVS